MSTTTTTKSADFASVAGDAKDRMNSDMDALKDAFSQLRKDVMHVVQGAVGVGKSSAAEAVDSARSHLTDLKDAGGDRVAAIEKRIEDNPLAAAAIAFGVGILVAKIMSHRR